MKYAILGFLCLLLLLSACEIKDFALPVWDIDLRIPLINDRYYTSELIDSLHIVSAADSVLQIVTTGELSTDEIFSVSLTPDVQINDISIPAGLQLNIKVPLQDTENNVQLSYGILTGGGLRYRFEDLGQDYDSMILRFEDIHNASGEVLQISAEGEQWVNLDLSGFSIGSYDSMEILDSLSITVICDSSVPEGTPVAAFSIDMSQALLFGIFQGLIVHMELGATDPAATLDVDYPLNIDQAVTLSTASIVINLSNELGFSTVFSGWFEARRDDQVVRVPILDDNGENYRIPAASGLNPGEVTLRFHDNISALMQIMPYHIELVQAKFVIDDESGFGTLNIENEIRADYTVEAPFRFTLHELPIEVDSVLTLEISEENRERIDQNLIDAGLEVQVKNTIPIGGTAYAYFGANPDIDTSDPASYSFVKSVTIHSSQSTTDWQDVSTLQLSRDELLLFTAEEVYLKWVFSFEASEGEVAIYARTSDYIALKGNIAARVRVEESE